jgi:hypothetical protein
MPLQHTLSFVDICDENQPENTSLPVLSPTPDMPAISRRRMGTLCGSALYNSLSGLSKPRRYSGTIPYQRSLQHYKERQIEKAQQNEGVVGGLAMDGSPSAPSYSLHSSVQRSRPRSQEPYLRFSPPVKQYPAPLSSYDPKIYPEAASIISGPSQPSDVGSSISEPPTMMKPSLRQSSPLGPRQHSLPGRPIFPPSVRKPDLYRHVLKKSARRTKIAVRHAGKESGGVEKVL